MTLDFTRDWKGRVREIMKVLDKLIFKGAWKLKSFFALGMVLTLAWRLLLAFVRWLA